MFDHVAQFELYPFAVQWIFSYSVSSACSTVFGGDVVKSMSWRTFIGMSVTFGLRLCLEFLPIN